MGSVRTLAGRNTLFFDFRFQGRRCREYTALEDTPANRRRLGRVLARIESEIKAGTFDYDATFPGSRAAPRHSKPSAASSRPVRSPQGGERGAEDQEHTPTFEEFSTTWLAEHKVEWRRSHVNVLVSTLNRHLVPRFGHQRVASITKADILAFRAELAELPGRGGAKLSNKRINGILGALQQILAAAAERFGFEASAPTVKPLRLRKTDIHPFTLDEVQQILATVRRDYRNYFVVRFFTGMRTGEVHGLKWKYVDFEQRLVLVRETFVLGEDEYTKTDSSQRDIQMTQVVYQALKAQHDATAAQSEYVFCNNQGHPLDNKNFSDRVWYPLLRHLELRKRRPYQMRHTAATLWLASGEAPEWIARQLGHGSTEMLFKVYSRFVPNLTRRDGSAIDRLLSTRFANTNLVRDDARTTERRHRDDSDVRPPPGRPPPPPSPPRARLALSMH